MPLSKRVGRFYQGLGGGMKKIPKQNISRFDETAPVHPLSRSQDGAWEREGSRGFLLLRRRDQVLRVIEAQL